MNYADVEKYLLEKTGATCDYPFGPDTAVFRVGKMFALVAWQEQPLRISLKCEPEQAEALRALYPSVQPGYHLNKRHWNTITLDGSIPEDELREMMDDSYLLIRDSLPKAEREALAQKETA